MVRTRVALILYILLVAHKTACQTLFETFLKSMRICTDFVDVGNTFHTGF